MKGLEKMKKWNSSWRRESKKSYLTNWLTARNDLYGTNVCVR